MTGWEKEILEEFSNKATGNYKTYILNKIKSEIKKYGDEIFGSHLGHTRKYDKANKDRNIKGKGEY